MSYRTNSSPVIYKISSPSGKVYIGQSWNYRERVRHYRQLKCERQTKLYASLLKYGVDNHTIEIVHTLPIDVSQDVLDNYEILYWEMYKDAGIDMMNLKEPGKAGKMSEEAKRNMSIAQRKRNKTMDFSHISKEVHQYEMDGKYINSFKSVNEAARITKAGSICAVANNRAHNKSSGGYRWSYDKLDNLGEYVNNSSKSRHIHLNSLK